MTYTLLFLLSLSTSFASMPENWFEEHEYSSTSLKTGTRLESDFQNLVSIQSKTLDELTEISESIDSSSNPFKLNEVITDIGFSKSGLLGISSLKATNGVEIRWKKKRSDKTFNEEENDEAQFVIIPDADEEDLKKIAKTIYELVKDSKVVRNHPKIEENILNALLRIKTQLDAIDVVELRKWKLAGLRFDINIGALGEVFYIGKIGVKFRARLDWKVSKANKIRIDRVSHQTKFIIKTLDDLNKASEKNTLTDFRLKQISIGAGVSKKGDLFGIWKYNAGFIGSLRFVPVVSNYKVVNSDLLNLVSSLENEDYDLVGESEDYVTGKGWRFWRVFIPRKKFVSGISKTFNTTSALAHVASQSEQISWYLSDIKTISNISKTGFFGLSSSTKTGIIELDIIRKL